VFKLIHKLICLDPRPDRLSRSEQVRGK